MHGIYFSSTLCQCHHMGDQPKDDLKPWQLNVTILSVCSVLLNNIEQTNDIVRVWARLSPIRSSQTATLLSWVGNAGFEERVWDRMTCMCQIWFLTVHMSHLVRSPVSHVRQVFSLLLNAQAGVQDYKRFSGMDWCSTHNLCSEMT